MKTTMMICTLLLLAGCATPGQNYTAEMSAAQITAAGKDKGVAIVCEHIVGAGYTIERTTISLDQNAIKDGGATVDASKGCVGNITTAAPPRPPAVVVVPKKE